MWVITVMVLKNNTRLVFVLAACRCSSGPSSAPIRPIGQVTDLVSSSRETQCWELCLDPPCRSAACPGSQKCLRARVSHESRTGRAFLVARSCCSTRACCSKTERLYSTTVNSNGRAPRGKLDSSIVRVCNSGPSNAAMCFGCLSLWFFLLYHAHPANSRLISRFSFKSMSLYTNRPSPWRSWSSCSRTTRSFARREPRLASPARTARCPPRRQHLRLGKRGTRRVASPPCTRSATHGLGADVRGHSNGSYPRLLQPHHGLSTSSRGSCKARSRHAGVSGRHGVAGQADSRPVSAGKRCWYKASRRGATQGSRCRGGRCGTSYRAGCCRRGSGCFLRAVRFRPSTRASAPALQTYEGRSR